MKFKRRRQKDFLLADVKCQNWLLEEPLTSINLISGPKLLTLMFPEFPIVVNTSTFQRFAESWRINSETSDITSPIFKFPPSVSKGAYSVIRAILLFIRTGSKGCNRIKSNNEKFRETTKELYTRKSLNHNETLAIHTNAPCSYFNSINFTYKHPYNA
jgi:hypothetical protein